uniref:Uncharacterized protein n=1 Tax=Arundo donax TaxID=35708 RepID=A0A0A9FHZ7_ARUDO
MWLETRKGKTWFIALRNLNLITSKNRHPI